MGDFFKSLRFKILLALLVVLLAFMLRAAYMGGLGTMADYVLGVVATPFQRLSASISYSVTDILDTLFRAGEYKSENEALREEIRSLRQQLVDYDAAIQENKQYKQFLEIKENNQDFQVELAAVIGRSPDARFGSETIDKGTIDGKELRDPGITADGLVGDLTEGAPPIPRLSRFWTPPSMWGFPMPAPAIPASWPGPSPFPSREGVKCPTLTGAARWPRGILSSPPASAGCSPRG